MKKNYFVFVVMLLCTAFAFSQGTITGKIMDGDLGGPLPGASVVVKGTTNGMAADFDGNFSITAPSNSGVLVVSYIGYITKEISFSAIGNVGKITLMPDAEALEEVIVVGSGVIDLAKERETPVAVSTISAKEIQLKVGNMEFPEILNSTPSVYATKQGGGYGDSRINLRGFDQTNTAVIINGQPVNDMENGSVYWSNWAGLSDIASGVQVQRGLGASKLAVPSVGGTMTIVTKSTEKEEGGFLTVSAGNDAYVKTVAAYNTGVNDKGWATSVLLGRWSGDGYVDGTEGEGYSYLISLGYKPSDVHAFNFTFTGAGQWHNQRRSDLSIRDHINFGGSDFRKFNSDYGTLDGEEYSFNRNFYNKPIGTLNWDWNINSKLTLATSVYGSWGRGGGTGSRGRNFGISPFREDLTKAIADGDLPYRTAQGTIDFDAIVANNKAGSTYTGSGPYENLVIGSNGYSEDGVNSNVAIRRASMNSHNWFGAISNLKYEINEKWTIGGGVDLRNYKGYHYRVVNDLLGLDAYYSTGNENLNTGLIQTETIKASPFRDTGLTSDKIDYYSVGEVKWSGFNGIVEYNNNNKLSAVLQMGISTQSYRRIDYFDQSNNVRSDKESKTGGYIKGGSNYNIDDKHNVFFNLGLIKRQPKFDAIFPNFANIVNEDAENETISSFEIGYGYKSSFLNANLNLYTTTWSDRFEARSINGVDNLNTGTAQFNGLKQVHSGIELDFVMRPVDKLKINGMLSVGDWKYKDNVTASVFDSNNDLVDTATLYIDDTKVGDAAQFTSSLAADYEIVKNFGIDLSWRHAANLYSDFSFQLDTRNWANDAQFLTPDNRGALKLPSYDLFDLGLDYKFDITDASDLSIRLNVNNLFDTEYISEASSSIYTDDVNPTTNVPSTTYKGIDTRNFVWFGFGRTFNVSLKYNF
ncbi:MAG: TonB-dependent receptor [Cellulophaga fucicola]